MTTDPHGKKKAHVKVDEWQSGGFHVDRHVKCRCGWTFTHYNRGVVNDQFKEHVQAATAKEQTT